MIRNFLNFFLSFLLLLEANPVYSNDISQKAVENYTLKISRKFSKTYCNTIKFGISQEGTLKFSIGETNKEFSNSKLNKFIDYQFLNKNIIFDLENNCQIYDLPLDQLGNLSFK